MTNILHLQSSFVFNKFPSHSLKVQVSMVASLKKQINDFAGIRVRQKKKKKEMLLCVPHGKSITREAPMQATRERSRDEQGRNGKSCGKLILWAWFCSHCTSPTPLHCWADNWEMLHCLQCHWLMGAPGNKDPWKSHWGAFGSLKPQFKGIS